MSFDNIVRALKDQLDCADGYANRNRTKDDHKNIPTTWEIQNSNIRLLVQELEEEVKRNRVIQEFVAFSASQENYANGDYDYKADAYVPYFFENVEEAYRAGAEYASYSHYNVRKHPSKAHTLNVAQEHLGDKTYYFYYKIANGNTDFLAWCLKRELDKVYGAAAPAYKEK